MINSYSVTNEESVPTYVMTISLQLVVRLMDLLCCNYCGAFGDSKVKLARLLGE